jgi:hypothetical protein
MRSFKDGDGALWDVVVGRESYGTVVALFLPKSGSESPRQAHLDVSSSDDGNRVLRELSADALMGLFRESVERDS